MVHDKAKRSLDFASEIQALRRRLAELEGAEANRQQAEAALARSEAFTQRLVQAAPLGILYLDAEGTITYENPAMREIMGIPPGTESPVLGAKLLDVPPVRETGLAPLVARCRQGETIVSQVVRYRSLMDRESDLEVHAAPIMDEDGTWQGAILMAQDITRRLQAEAENRRHSQELALLNRVIAASAASDTIVLILEATCRELALAFGVPQAAAALLDEDGSQATVVAEYRDRDRPSGLAEVIPVDDNFSYQHLLTEKTPLVVDDAQHDPRLAPAVRDLMRRRGTVSLLLVPLLVEGEVVGSLGLDAIEPRPFSPQEVNLAQRVAEQVSGALTRVRLEQDNQLLEEQFRQVQKMEALSQMAGGVVHDFNNLLTVIGTTTQMLEQQLYADDPIREQIGWIREAGKQAEDLVRQLASFGQREPIEAQVVDMNQMILALQPLLERILGESRTLVLDLDEQLWATRIEPSQLDQAIMNLVMNAQAATPTGGQITIKTGNTLLDAEYVAMNPQGKLGEHVTLTVQDDGIGMSEEVMSHIFEPFFSTRTQGTGLGLSTVYGIVTHNQGHIKVTSVPGKGASFCLYLPRATREPQPLPPPISKRAARATGGKETILVAEDEKGVRKLTCRILEDHGYQVLAGEDGVTALEISQTYDGPIHLLLTDVIMPRLNGRELAREVKGSRPSVRILFMSGYTGEVVSHDGRLSPGIGFLPKPFSMDSLVAKVQDVLDQNGEEQST
ncbi:MAG: ATP-binding protein [Anaerolineae bacterium]|jgi:PAS domain S-box-containing protein